MAIEISTLNELQAMEDDLSADYVLVNNIDASDTENWNQLIDQGDWQNDTDYEINDFVSNDGADYYCANPHTSDSASEPGTGDDWTDYWIEATESEAGNYLGFHPIGRYPYGGWPSNWVDFEGTLDGKGYEIKNLYIDRPDERTVGLFGFNRLDETEVKNIGVVNATVSGENRVGGLVGRNRNSATVSNSYSVNATVNGDNQVGGLVGRSYNSATVSDSYATGSVDCSDVDTGGLIGRNYDGDGEESTIENCYSTVEIVDNGGGLIGTIGGDGTVNITASFWDTEASGTETGINDDSGTGTRDLEGLTTVEMYKYDTYSSDWDIKSVKKMVESDDDYTWNINDTLNYPFLSNEGQGLEGWWKMDEGEGDTVYDSSGNDNDGTRYGKPSWISHAWKYLTKIV